MDYKEMSCMNKLIISEKHQSSIGVIVTLLVVLALLILTIGVTCCSGKSSSSTTAKQTTVNGHSVSEYNADVDNLSRILNSARNLDHQIDSMGNPDNFTRQEQVDQYNSLVNEYNSYADQYRSAVREFNKKYAANAEGDGNRSTDPDNIDLPKKIQ